jgi:hypothetical protein
MIRMGAKARTPDQGWEGVTIVLLALLLFGADAPRAAGRLYAPQASSAQKPPLPPESKSERSQEEKEPKSASRDPLADPEKELLDRAAIEYRKAEHRRALEASAQILKRVQELDEQWGRRQQLRRSEELLQEIERFARRVRSISGASDLEAREPVPDDPARALARLRESAERLHALLKTLTAYVISVEVMERSDEIVRLARYLRERMRSDRGT